MGTSRRLISRPGVTLPLAFLLLLALLLGVNWLSLSLVRAPDAPRSNTTLSWQREFGEPGPGEPFPATLPEPSTLATHLLPEVLSVADAVEWRDGWILLDERLGKLHFLHTNRGLVQSFGREGEGPGELQDPVALAMVDTVLWVLNRHGLVLDRFDTDMGFLDRREVRGGGCLVGLAKEIVFLGSGSPLLVRFCPPSLPGPGTAWVEALSAEGILTPVLSLPLGDTGSRRLHLAREPILTGTTGTFFLGTWDAPCLAEFGVTGDPMGRRCLPSYSRPRTNDEERTDLKARFRGITRLGLLPLEIPTHLPWYDRAFATSQGVIVRRIRGPEERDLVLLPDTGASIQLDHLFPTNTFVGERTILAVQDLLQGTRIDVYPNPWR